MEIIENNSISGFETRCEVIEILDEKMRRFYYYENPTQKRVVFNLPCGNFFTEETEIFRLKKPLRYVCPELPKPDKKIVPVDMEFVVTNNPFKCSIDVNTGTVIIDHTIANKAIPFFNFVLLHEVGHNYYNGGTHEHFCDIFAAKMMLEKFGYNKSQIYFAQEFCLSEKSINRKDYLFNYLKKCKMYE